MNKLKVRNFSIYLIICLIIAMSLGGMGYIYHSGVKIITKFSPLADAAIQIRLETSYAHLWFEEIISGDKGERIDTVWQHIDQAKSYAQSILDGINGKSGPVVALEQPEVRAQIVNVLKALSLFRAAAEQRLNNPIDSQVGSSSDQKFDAVFRHVINEADAIEILLRQIIAEELIRYKKTTLFVGILSVVLIMVFVSILGYMRRQEKKVAAELHHSAAALRAILDNSPFMTWLKDPNGCYLTVNKALADYIGLQDIQQAVGKTDFDFWSKDLAEKYRADDVEIVTTRRQKHIEEQVYDGEKMHWIETFITPIIDEQGNILGTTGFALDITARKQAEEELRIAATAFDTQQGMVLTDTNGTILRVNQAFTRLTGYSAEEAVGKTPHLLSSGRQDQAFYQNMWENLLEQRYWQGEVWNRRKDGTIYAEWLTISAVPDTNGGTAHYLGSFSEITQHKEAEAEIHRLAYYDPLTQLPNRRLLNDRLSQALAASSRSGKYGALLFIDLDNFKTLNDTLGHDMGDVLLQQVARRLVSCVREGDTVAREGGDEFIVLLENLGASSGETAILTEIIGEKILTTLNLPYQLASYDYHSTPSIGITLFIDHLSSEEELLKRADIAMYQAKRSGRNAMCFFDPAMQAVVTAHAKLEADLHSALAQNQFKLYFQMQTRHGQIIGAEVLLRWQHPERGLVEPLEFISLTEETGLIIPIGLWVLEVACIQLKIWESTTQTQHLQLAVNVSARQFHQTDFVEQVCAVLEKTAIKPGRLKLELTESLVLDNIDETIIKMQALKEIGVRFSMDDFGTGFSSLAYLTQLPLDQLKIDQSFVHNIGVLPTDAIIVQTIIGMADSLGMEVIAEGVETEEQRVFLELHGCPDCQGYLLGRPVPLMEFESSLRLALLGLKGI